MTQGTAARLLLLAACLAGCAPFMVLQEARRTSSDGRPQVLSLPPDYDPAAALPAYDGPHPRHRDWQPDQRHYPVDPGEIGPVDHSLGAPQYPFACDTEASRLGPPLPDNQQGWGTPVHRDGRVIGYSLDCQVATRIQWFYKPRGYHRLRRYDPQRPPGDVAMLEHDGRQVPFVVRVERGTINRFIYVIGVLAEPQTDSLDLWNRRLLYHFGGGVGIGKRQGRGTVNTAFARLIPALASGYAVAFSSGTRTDTHYDMRRAGRTAAMVKAQFLAAYGEPAATIGIGASGGAALQYVLAQNHPGLLDGLIPIYSYPDVVTQASWVLDCELLEHYFDLLANDPRWRRQTERTAVQGLPASGRARNPFSAMDGWARLLRLERPGLPRGASACATAWRPVTPLIDNPRYTGEPWRYGKEVLERERWSYWHDLRRTFGVDERGFARRTWGNAGVQYGLVGLRNGKVSPEVFLHLNANVGSWQPPRRQQAPRFWLLSGPLSEHGRLRELSIWSAHNMQTNDRREAGRPEDFAPDSTALVPVAPRRHADPRAVRAARLGGQVFLGAIDVPVLDVRHYLDPDLDMHHSFASLAVRARLARHGNAGRQVIWVAQPGWDFLPDALTVMDRWLAGGRPPGAEDACFRGDGRAIARGPGVWDGPWNGRPAGACHQQFPPFASPRAMAGEPVAGDVLSCRRVPVADFLVQGGYGPVDMGPYLHHLQRVFPDGVCDYHDGSDVEDAILR